MANGDDGKIGTYEPTVPNKNVDAEEFTGSQGTTLRQRVAAPYLEQIMGEFAHMLRIIANNTPTRNGALDASRVELVGAANTIATLSSVTTVATVNTVANQTNAGGVSMTPGQYGQANAGWAALRAKIGVS